MKTTILIFLLAFSCSTFAQTIRRCNNNPVVTGVNVYTTIQAAHDAAVAGDIIYVEPSTADYGTLDIRKRLTIIGNGYFLDKNANVSFDSRTSKISTTTFNNGSASSIIIGIDFNSGSMNINDVNITVTRCRIGTIIFARSLNLVAGAYSRGNNGTITKSIIGSVNGNHTSTVLEQYGYNCLISNNIQRGGNNSITNSVLSNNVFYDVAPLGGVTMFNLNGCTVVNNIYDARGFNSTISYVSSGSGNSISNNICLGAAGVPSGNGNVSFGNPTDTFLTANPGSTISIEDAPFQLALGSPAIGIGTGGTNAGAFGGANPYVLSGLPPYPIITNFITSGVGNSTTPLNVSVTVRGNN